MSVNCKISCITISLILLMAFMETDAFPFVFNRPYRTGRDIRTPYKSGNDLGVARGFGKRNAVMSDDIMVARDYGKREAATVDVAHDFGNKDVGNLITSDQNEINRLFDEQERVPIEWFSQELRLNPGLIRAILHKFVDINKDGMISERELLGAFENNNIFY